MMNIDDILRTLPVQACFTAPEIGKILQLKLADAKRLVEPGSDGPPVLSVPGCTNLEHRVLRYDLAAWIYSRYEHNNGKDSQ